MRYKKVRLVLFSPIRLNTLRSIIKKEMLKLVFSEKSDLTQIGLFVGIKVRFRVKNTLNRVCFWT